MSAVDGMSGDPFSLERFVAAQEQGGTYARGLAELRAGRKHSHWMWFVFPQIAGLGRSSMARTYAIGSLAEAEAYLNHPLLGARLRECAKAMMEQGGRSAKDILGPIDVVKLRSSMTLFARAAPHEPLFQDVLAELFAGVHDEATVRLLAVTH